MAISLEESVLYQGVYSMLAGFGVAAVLETSGEAAQRIGDSSEKLNEITESIVEGAGQVNRSMESMNGVLEEQYHNVNDGKEELNRLDERIVNYREKFTEMNQAVAVANEKLSENVGLERFHRGGPGGSRRKRLRCGGGGDPEIRGNF